MKYLSSLTVFVMFQTTQPHDVWLLPPCTQLRSTQVLLLLAGLVLSPLLELLEGV